MSTSETCTLTAAAERSGLTPHQVRIYLDMGLLRPCARSDGGYRLFDAECVRRLRLIKVCRDADIGLAEIGVFIRSLDGEDRARCREAERLLSQRLSDKRLALDAKYVSDLAHFRRQDVTIHAVHPSVPRDVGDSTLHIHTY